MADRGEHFVSGTVMAVEHCCNCGMVFAMTLEHQERRRKDRKLFYCPAGHPQHYTGASEEEKLRSELERQRQMREAEAARAASLQQERDQVSRAHNRMRVRVMNGVCPCCNRTFQNLARHMKTEHAGEFNLKTLRAAFGMTQTDVAKEAGVYVSAVSLYERGRPVATYVKTALDSWIDRHASSRHEGALGAQGGGA